MERKKLGLRMMVPSWRMERNRAIRARSIHSAAIMSAVFLDS
jgi:hypothetical protein